MIELTGAKSASFSSCVNFLYSTRSYKMICDKQNTIIIKL